MKLISAILLPLFIACASDDEGGSAGAKNKVSKESPFDLKSASSGKEAAFAPIPPPPAPSHPGKLPPDALQVWDRALLLDVRTQGEFQESHVPGAHLLPFNEIPKRMTTVEPDFSRPIIAYCRSGNRSGIAKGYLEKLGYTHVVNAGSLQDLIPAFK